MPGDLLSSALAVITTTKTVKWTAYPQSHFGNWTTKPVRNCGIEAAVKNHEHPLDYLHRMFSMTAFLAIPESSK